MSREAEVQKPTPTHISLKNYGYQSQPAPRQKLQETHVTSTASGGQKVIIRKEGK